MGNFFRDQKGDFWVRCSVTNKSPEPAYVYHPFGMDAVYPGQTIETWCRGPEPITGWQH